MKNKNQGHIPMTLRYSLTDRYIKSRAGVYNSQEELIEYWLRHTGVRAEATHVPSVFAAMQRNGESVHVKDGQIRFETEALRAERLDQEATALAATKDAERAKDLARLTKLRAKRTEALQVVSNLTTDIEALESKISAKWGIKAA